MIVILLECRDTFDEEKDRYPRGGNHPFEEPGFHRFGKWMVPPLLSKKEKKEKRITKDRRFEEW